MWILYMFSGEDEIELIKASSSRTKLIAFKKEMLKPSIAYLKACKKYTAQQCEITNKFFSKENFTMFYNDSKLDTILNFLKKNPYFLSRRKEGKNEPILDDATCEGLISKTGKWVPTYPDFEYDTPKPFFYDDQIRIEKIEVI
jgi:hypothetical protein